MSNIKTIKVSELTGVLLDWTVAKAGGGGSFPESFLNGHAIGRCNYSADWAQGGQIIEREGISLKQWHGAWTAELEYLPDDDANYRYGKGSGSTPLIAAMRCYVASKLGDTVEVPKELNYD